MDSYSGLMMWNYFLNVSINIKFRGINVHVTVTDFPHLFCFLFINVDCCFTVQTIRISFSKSLQTGLAFIALSNSVFSESSGCTDSCGFLWSSIGKMVNPGAKQPVISALFLIFLIHVKPVPLTIP